jgi:predicted dehydrogenase
MRVALVGCGFISDRYVTSIRSNYPSLEIVGVTDQSAERASQAGARYSLDVYESLERLLDDERVDIVLNLTNPRSHYEVSRACLQAGKHVYSEKPLAMDLDEARELVDLAARNNLYLSSAPCSVLGEAAQATARALREERVGDVLAVYAEMDDGLVPRMPFRSWRSPAGVPWPFQDEFEVGCTFEHAGYSLTWLAAFFGPAELVSAFSSVCLPDKGTDQPLQVLAPDLSIACIRFVSGVVARLTCSIVAPHDRRLRIVGRTGVLQVDDVWDYGSPAYTRQYISIRRRMVLSPWKKRCRLPVRRPRVRSDFARGVAELADAITEGRPARLSANFALHVNELTLAIHNAGAEAAPYKVTSRFDPVEPMPWAR